MKRRLLALVTGLALFAGVAWAQVTEGLWARSPGGSVVASKVTDDESAYFDFDASLTDSAILHVACEGATVTKRGAAGDAKLRACEEQGDTCSSTTDCNEIKWDVDGDGISDSTSLDGSSANRTTLYNLEHRFVCVDPQSCATGTCRITVECKGR